MVSICADLCVDNSFLHMCQVVSSVLSGKQKKNAIDFILFDSRITEFSCVNLDGGKFAFV